MPRTPRQPNPPIAQPWDRLPAESPEAYEAFRCYLDLQPKRSIDRAAAALGKDDSLLWRWSVRHRWVERCRAKSDHDYRKREEAKDAERDAANEGYFAAAHAEGMANYRRQLEQQIEDCRPEAAYRAMVAAGKVPSFASANDICSAVRRAKYRARKNQRLMARVGIPARYFQHPLKPGGRLPSL